MGKVSEDTFRKGIDRMHYTTQILNTEEITNLGQILGSKWVNISGDGLVDADFCVDCVFVNTNSISLRISLDMSPIAIDGEIDDYPNLRIEATSSESEAMRTDGKVFFHGRGEVVQEIYVLRETLLSIRSGENFFENVADICVAIRLENMWISFVRASHFSEVFFVKRTYTRDEIELPDTVEEWGPDLIERYQSTIEWIRVGGAGNNNK